jgi:hypothetical protein
MKIDIPIVSLGTMVLLPVKTAAVQKNQYDLGPTNIGAPEISRWRRKCRFWECIPKLCHKAFKGVTFLEEGRQRNLKLVLHCRGTCSDGGRRSGRRRRSRRRRPGFHSAPRQASLQPGSIFLAAFLSLSLSCHAVPLPPLRRLNPSPSSPFGLHLNNFKTKKSFSLMQRM